MAVSFHKEGRVTSIYETNLTPSLLIEVPVPSQESDQSYLYLLGVSIMSPVTSIFNFRIVPSDSVVCF